MAQTTEVAEITIAENGVVLYSEVTQTMDDDNIISETYHRTGLAPGQDLANVPDQVVAICNTAWTAEIIAAYQAKITLLEAK
jgi:hypothetical protein